VGSRTVALLLGGLLAAGALVLVVSGSSTPPPLRTGGAAPAFALPDLDGQQVALDDLRGQVVLVNFWATWCKPCEDEMPAMQRLHDALAPSGFELLAVSVDESDEPVREFQERLGLHFPILMDPAKDVADTYQSFRFPESFLVGRDGTLVARYIGPRDWDAPAYVDRIRRLLDEGDAAAPGAAQR
jgi:peroxiredoxin